MEKHAIIYIAHTDYGWGVHGYFYGVTSKLPKSYLNLVLTDDGYKHKSALQGLQTVTPTHMLDIYMSSDALQELDALNHVLDYLISKEVVSIRIYMAAQYINRSINEFLPTWAKNNWKRADGLTIQKATTWKHIYESLETYKQLNIPVNIRYDVRTECPNGYDQALMIARMSKDRPFTACISEANVYLKEVVERHPFMCFKRMYFSNSIKVDDTGFYFIAEPGDKDHTFGKRLADVAYAVVHFTTPLQEVEMVKRKQRSIYSNHIKTVMLRLDRVYDKAIYPYIDRHGGDCMMQDPDSRTVNLNFLDGRNVTEEIRPVRLTMRAMENFTYLEGMLTQFDTSGFRGNDDYIVKDITDMFYDEHVSKGKNTLKLKGTYIVGFRDTEVKIQTTIEGKSVTIKVPLVLGSDMPHRNNLKHLEEMNPKILLVLHKESNSTYRYATIVSCDGAIGIWSNFHSDRVFLKEEDWKQDET